MRKHLFKAVLLMMMFMSSSIFLYAQVGPVVSISQTPASLPSTITTFLNSYFPGALPSDVELKTLSNIYEIELDNNIDLKFDAKSGQWLDIDAPDKSTISQVIISDLLPGEIYNNLQRRNLVYKINEMEYNPKFGYKLETDRGRDMYFDLNGNKIKKPWNW